MKSGGALQPDEVPDLVSDFKTEGGLPDPTLCHTCGRPHRLIDADAGSDREMARQCISCFNTVNVHRWNFENRGGEIWACKHEHDKGQPCEYEEISAGEAIAIMRQQARALNEHESIRHLVVYEELRSGIQQAHLRAAEYGDRVLMACMRAHHSGANRAIEALGGEVTELVDLESLVEGDQTKDEICLCCRKTVTDDNRHEHLHTIFLEPLPAEAKEAVSKLRHEHC